MTTAEKTAALASPALEIAITRIKTASPWIVISSITVALIVLWHVAGLPGVLLSIGVTIIGILALRWSTEALLAWLVSVLQFHPDAFAPIAEISQIGVAPIDVGMLLLVARLSLLVRARKQGLLVLRRIVTRAPFVVLFLFAIAGMISLGYGLQEFGGEKAFVMSVSFAKLLEGTVFLLLVTCVLALSQRPVLDRLVMTLTGLLVIQSIYAVVGVYIHAFFFLDVSPMRLGLPAESGDLPLFSGYGPFQYVAGARAVSLIGGPAQTATIASIGTLFALSLSRSSVRRAHRALWSAAAVVCLLAVALSFSRTAWLGMAVVSGLALAVLSRDRWHYGRILAMTFVLVLPLWPVLLNRVAELELTAISSPGTIPADVPRPPEEVTQIVLAVDGTIRVDQQRSDELTDRSSSSLRLATWRFGLFYFAQSPLLGFGWSAPRFLVEKDDGVLRGLLPTVPEQAFVRSAGSMHNAYLDLAVGNGAVGLGLFLLFTVMVLRAARRAQIQVGEESLGAFAILGGLVYFLTDALGDSWLLSGSPTAWYFWVLSAVALAWRYGAEGTTKHPGTREPARVSKG